MIGKCTAREDSNGHRVKFSRSMGRFIFTCIISRLYFFCFFAERLWGCDFRAVPPLFFIFHCSCLDRGASSMSLTQHSHAYSLKQGQLSLAL